nr:MAG TPA: hypothetical protein [Caudoviricetes sp.]DAU28870.1 MAG TPA: hypothetical protein [Caudoviricetes sp.]DAV93401.1 MAG TPA: hypothetical protein [Caudoviricetes sp.]DAX25399.1 MAG TPA: hypothetical protein [Caudoviricetes sp.]
MELMFYNNSQQKQIFQHRQNLTEYKVNRAYSANRGYKMCQN